jgi:N-methylhydantoinase B
MDAALKAKITSAGYRPDPVTTEIVRNGLIAATEEMKTNLRRTAYNMIIYEALDFTVGLFDAEGNTVSIGLGLPMFIRGMSDTVKTKLEHYGVENLDPGDILLTNDAYITGSHLNHMTFTVPIFHDGEVVAFSCCMAHWPDVGGTLDGATTDIFSEGLQMPIVKIYRKGVPNEELISIIRTNVRLPERAMGDFRAQIAAVKTGERRFLEMIHKYGRDAVIGGIEAIMDHSEAAARARVREIPDGVYEAESFMDDDGIKLGERVPIRVRVEIAGDRMKVDLTDVAKQVAGFYNSGETAGRSCCQVAFKCLTSALDLPINDGQFRALEIVLPPGRVVSALKPAAMRMWMTYPMTIIDTIFKALAPAIPEHIIAGHHADLVVGRVNGRRPKDDSFYIYLGGLIGGGWGAKHNSDGCNATIAMNDGDTHNGPSEQVEAKYPLLVERYALRPDSGGAGRFRGGLGCEQVVQARYDLRFNSQMDRVKCKPWGLEASALPAIRSRSIVSPQRRSSASTTARRSTKSCTRAMPIFCAPAAAAASARRSSATSKASRATCAAAMSASMRPRRFTARYSCPAATTSTRRRLPRAAPRCAGKGCRGMSRSPIPACRCRLHHMRMRTTMRTRSSAKRSAWRWR